MMPLPAPVFAAMAKDASLRERDRGIVNIYKGYVPMFPASLAMLCLKYINKHCKHTTWIFYNLRGQRG